MLGFLNTIALVLFLAQIILSIALRTEVIVQKLNTLDNLISGITKIINLKDSESLSDMSMFGWIKMIYSDTVKDIIEIKGVKNSQYHSGNITQDMIFYLQYLNWGTPKLKFSWYINLKEEQSLFDLSPEEQNTWIFVYFGHSFQSSKQTYYLKSMFNEQIVTKPVSKIENMEYCMLSAGVGQYNAKEFIYGTIERLTVQTGQGAYRESNFEVLNVFDPDKGTGCAVGYDQCGYIGQPIELCGGLEKPKSVLLEGMESVMICANHQEIIVRRNIDCIDDGDLISLHMAYAIDFSDNPNDQCEKL